MLRGARLILLLEYELLILKVAYLELRNMIDFNEIRSSTRRVTGSEALDESLIYLRSHSG